jgi:putative transposase
VKHGLVKNVADWPWSSFHRYVRLGFYDPDWGGGNADEFEKMSFGE